MNKRETAPRISPINNVLEMDLVIPKYQRPYKWTTKNVLDLLHDIDNSIDESNKHTNFKYRVGTVILHKDKDGKYEIVDGQQRLLTFVLLNLFLNNKFKCSLLSTEFDNKTSQRNLHNNFSAIRDWFASKELGKKESGKESKDNEKIKQFRECIENVLEAVVITVNQTSEAFQLFDSQNTRGRALYPHDLLKAYHLREIHDKYELQEAVERWEKENPDKIRELFDSYLFPIWNWTKRQKCGSFTAKNIDIYKGISEETGYTFAKRASRTAPYFQLTEDYLAGNDFFLMVHHYMQMVRNIKQELIDNPNMRDMLAILTEKEETKEERTDSIEKFDKAKRASAGFNHTRQLFLCALLCYYDRFHNFDIMAVRKMFSWAMMVRVDMKSLGYDTINRYVTCIDNNDHYSNHIPLFAKIACARRHEEISGIKVDLTPNENAKSEKWQPLHKNLLKLNGCD